MDPLQGVSRESILHSLKEDEYLKALAEEEGVKSGLGYYGSTSKLQGTKGGKVPSQKSHAVEFDNSEKLGEEATTPYYSKRILRKCMDALDTQESASKVKSNLRYLMRDLYFQRIPLDIPERPSLKTYSPQSVREKTDVDYNAKLGLDVPEIKHGKEVQYHKTLEDNLESMTEGPKVQYRSETEARVDPHKLPDVDVNSVVEVVLPDRERELEVACPTCYAKTFEEVVTEMSESEDEEELEDEGEDEEELEDEGEDEEELEDEGEDEEELEDEGEDEEELEDEGEDDYDSSTHDDVSYEIDGEEVLSHENDLADTSTEEEFNTLGCERNNLKRLKTLCHWSNIVRDLKEAQDDSEEEYVTDSSGSPTSSSDEDSNYEDSDSSEEFHDTDSDDCDYEPEDNLEDKGSDIDYEVDNDDETLSASTMEKDAVSDYRDFSDAEDSAVMCPPCYTKHYGEVLRRLQERKWGDKASTASEPDFDTFRCPLCSPLVLVLPEKVLPIDIAPFDSRTEYLARDGLPAPKVAGKSQSKETDGLDTGALKVDDYFASDSEKLVGNKFGNVDALAQESNTTKLNVDEKDAEKGPLESGRKIIFYHSVDAESDFSESLADKDSLSTVSAEMLDSDADTSDEEVVSDQETSEEEASKTKFENEADSIYEDEERQKYFITELKKLIRETYGKGVGWECELARECELAHHTLPYNSGVAEEKAEAQGQELVADKSKLSEEDAHFDEDDSGLDSDEVYSTDVHDSETSVEKENEPDIANVGTKSDSAHSSDSGVLDQDDSEDLCFQGSVADDENIPSIPVPDGKYLATRDLEHGTHSTAGLSLEPPTCHTGTGSERDRLEIGKQCKSPRSMEEMRITLVSDLGDPVPYNVTDFILDSPVESDAYLGVLYSLEVSPDVYSLIQSLTVDEDLQLLHPLESFQLIAEALSQIVAPQKARIVVQPPKHIPRSLEPLVDDVRGILSEDPVERFQPLHVQAGAMMDSAYYPAHFIRDELLRDFRADCKTVNLLLHHVGDILEQALSLTLRGEDTCVSRLYASEVMGEAVDVMYRLCRAPPLPSTEGNLLMDICLCAMQTVTELHTEPASGVEALTALRMLALRLLGRVQGLPERERRGRTRLQEMFVRYLTMVADGLLHCVFFTPCKVNVWTMVV